VVGPEAEDRAPMAVDLLDDPQSEDGVAANEEMRQLGLESYHMLHEQGRRREWEEFLRGIYGPGESHPFRPTSSGDPPPPHVFAQRQATFPGRPPPPPPSADVEMEAGSSPPAAPGPPRPDGSAGADLISSESDAGSETVEAPGEGEEIKDEVVEEPVAGDPGDVAEPQGDEEKEDSSDEEEGRPARRKIKRTKTGSLGFIESGSGCMHVVEQDNLPVGYVLASNGIRYKIHCNKGLRKGMFHAVKPPTVGGRWDCGDCPAVAPDVAGSGGAAAG
jgi:hypothetical protein